VTQLTAQHDQPKSLGHPLPHWEWCVLFALLVGLLVGHIGNGLRRGYGIAGVDAIRYYAPLRSLVFDGDFDYRNEIGELPKGPREPRIVPATGYAANKYGAGWAVVAILPFAAVHVGGLLLGWVSGAGYSPTGYELHYQLTATCSQVVAGWLGMVLSYRLVRSFFPARACVAAFAAVLVGSPLLYYCCIAVDFAHAAGFFCVSLLLYMCFLLGQRQRDRWFHWALLGGAAGLMTILRPSNVLVCVVFLYPLVARLRRKRAGEGEFGSLLRGCLIVAIAAAPFLFFQMLIWRRVYGVWIADAYAREGEYFNWLAPEFLGYLFSPRHGLFFFSPVLLIATLGLVLAILRKGWPVPRLALALMAAAAVGLVYVNSSWWCWWFGWAFGARAFVEMSPVFLLGLAGLLSVARGRWRWAALGLICICILWSSFLLLLHATNSIPPDGAKTLAEFADGVQQLFR